MSSTWIDPKITHPNAGQCNAGAIVVEGVTGNDRPCRIVDNTGTVDPAELKTVLDTLIREQRFGVKGLSPQGGNTIPIDRPAATHIQFGDRLYRILLFPYEARIEPF